MEFPMLKKLWPYILLLSLNLWAKLPDPVVEKLWDKNYLKTSLGKEIILVRMEFHGGEPNYHRLFMRQGKKIIWDKTFSQEYGALWNRAYFIPLVPDEFFLDLNDDGYPEIAVGTSHGGQAVWSNLAMIFTVKDDGLEFLKSFPINVEFSRSVYEKKTDFSDPTYLCRHCQ